MPDFKNADGSSRITANVIASPGATRPGDEVGHGTHVAGIIAGNSFNRDPGDPARGAYVGIAPEADLIAIKVADDDGDSTVLDVIAALQFVVDHKDELNIRVVNLSVSSDTPASYLDDPLDAAVEFAWHAGIVVVAAAGNRGDAADAVQYAPGNDPYVISVGATDEVDTVDPSDDTIAAFSSRGITQDGVAKPDVVAPGVRIVAPLAMGSAFQTLCPQCVVGELPAHRRHVGGGPGRRGRRGAPAPGPPRAQPRRGQGAPDRAHQPDRRRPVAPAGAPSIGLGTADGFAVLAGSTVTNTGPSTINGDLGLHPGTAVTGFGPGTVNGTTHAANAVALQAKSDLTAAYDDAAGRTPPAPAPADLGGLTLTPGVYRSASSLALTGELTLDAQGDPSAVFVFQAGSTLITASASRVRLVNGAQAVQRLLAGRQLRHARDVDGLRRQHPGADVDLDERRRHAERAGAGAQRRGHADQRHDHRPALRDRRRRRRRRGARRLARAVGRRGRRRQPGLRPNHLVEQVLVEAGVDPTRATWTRAQWTRAQWTRAQWTRAQWTRAQVDARRSGRWPRRGRALPGPARRVQ